MTTKSEPPSDKASINLRVLYPYLQPLRAVGGGSTPGIGLALLVQAGIVWVPGEGLDAPGPEGAGGCQLAI